MPPAFVISLARASERRATLAERMQGIPYEIVDAVDGASLDLDALAAEGRLLQSKAKKLCRRELTRGEIGCYLSHYTLWEHIAQQPQACALVLEDDVEFAEDFQQVVQDIVNSPWHWEVVNLAAEEKLPIKKTLHSAGNGRSFGLSLRLGYCASAYLIRPSGARKLLHYCRQMYEPIDAMYIRWWRHGAVFYYVSPPPAQQQVQQFASHIGARVLVNPPISDRIAASIHRKQERIARKWATLKHRPRKVQGA